MNGFSVHNKTIFMMDSDDQIDGIGSDGARQDNNTIIRDTRP
jgi:hypothetical protein